MNPLWSLLSIVTLDIGSKTLVKNQAFRSDIVYVAQSATSAGKAARKLLFVLIHP